VVVFLFGGALAALLAGQRVRQHRIVASPATASAEDPWAPDEYSAVPALLPARPVYKYSVIPGGVYSATELTHAVKRDPVVGAVYASLVERGVRPEVVQTSRLAYMSYRIGDRIYWSKHQIALRAGETILTDGESEIRGRCGNGISMDPMLPTSEAEPEPTELDALAPAEATLLPSHRLGFEFADVAGGQSPGLSGMDGLGSGFGSGGGSSASAANSGTGLIATTAAGAGFPFASGTVPGGVDIVTGGGLHGTPGTDPIDTSLVPGGPGVPGIDVPFVPPGFPPVFPPIDGGTPLNPGDPNIPTGGLPTPTPLPDGPSPVPEPGTLLLLGGGLAMAMRRLRGPRP
jgi:hypothetical protein